MQENKLWQIKKNSTSSSSRAIISLGASVYVKIDNCNDLNYKNELAKFAQFLIAF